MNLPITSSAVEDEEDEEKFVAQKEVAIKKKKIELMEPIAARYDTNREYAKHFESCFNAIQNAGASEFESAIFADESAKAHVKAERK